MKFCSECGARLLIQGTMRAWPTPLGATLNTSTAMFGVDGRCIDATYANQLRLVASQVVGFARFKEAAPGKRLEPQLN